MELPADAKIIKTVVYRRVNSDGSIIMLGSSDSNATLEFRKDIHAGNFSSFPAPPLVEVKPLLAPEASDSVKQAIVVLASNLESVGGDSFDVSLPRNGFDFKVTVSRKQLQAIPQ